MTEKDIEIQRLNQQINDLKNFNEAARFSAARSKPGHGAVHHAKFNDRLPNQFPELISSIDRLHDAVNKLVISNEHTQTILAKQMDLIEQQGKLLNDIESRTNICEQKQTAFESQLHKQGSIIYNHDVKLDQLEQQTLCNDVLLSGPAITQFLKDLPSITYGCSFSEPTNTKAISDFLNSEISKVDNTAKNVSVISYSKISVEGRSDMLLATFGSSNEKLHLIRSLAKGKTGKIFCTERMTKTRQEIHYRLRQLKKDAPDSGLMVLTRNGNPAVRMSPRGKVRQISTPVEYEEFTKWFLKKFPLKRRSPSPPKDSSQNGPDETLSQSANGDRVASNGSNQGTPMTID